MAKQPVNPWMFWGEIIIEVVVVIFDALKTKQTGKR